MQKKTFKIFSVIVFAVAMILLTVIAIPLITSYNNPEQFKAYIDGFGTWGFPIMLLIQIAQIVVALIPGEIIELVAGTIYGWFWGTLFCCLGILIGQFLIFKTVKFLGRDFVNNVAGSKVMNKFKFLQDEKKLKSVIFFLFFIPGTPKDLITYVVPLTKVPMRDFLIITLIARIPSVISSTYAGSAIADRDYMMLVIVYAAILIFTVCGALIYHFWDKKRAAKENNE